MAGSASLTQCTFGCQGSDALRHTPRVGFLKAKSYCMRVISVISCSRARDNRPAQTLYTTADLVAELETPWK